MFRILWTILILLLCSEPGDGAWADELSVNRFDPSRVTAFTLPNGLKVLLYPDASQPELTVNIVYRTGAKHEKPGEYGMAHLLEHLLFQGTQRYPEIPKEWQRRGARFNANTNADRTTYYATLPASPENLEFALSLEADRMRHGVLSDAAIQKEMAAVKKEWEQSGQSGFQPLLKEMLRIAYPHHAYGRDTFGLQEGLLESRAEDLRAFYHRRYGPNLAVLSLGGNFATHEARRLIEKYFAGIPNLKLREESVLPLRAQQGARQVTLSRPGAPAYVGVLYRAMFGTDANHAPAQALVHCLVSSPQSILQTRLVRTGWVEDAFGFVQQSADEGFIAFMARPARGQDPLQVAQRMSSLVEDAALSCGSHDLPLFQKENHQAWAELIRDTRALTMQLGEYEVLGGWQRMAREESVGHHLQPKDVKDAARWLTHNNRVLGVLDPRTPGNPPPDKVQGQAFMLFPRPTGRLHHPQP
ncbi:M16 family metallopeptidase [Oligoflexus tunisiensis]|uniref:M16 family metallopeptidase n=1 Tax=Oligoflexus tunisiensis TaxID=708132 RepID=UPI00114CDAA8|nr:pitrilysin family protein [Oligoflexus tunisiensis]